ADAPPEAPATASPAPPAPGPAQTPAPAAEAGDEDGDDSGRTFVSPVVARMLAEHRLDISQIPGTGRGGRVTKKDVQTFLDGGGGQAAPADPGVSAVHDVPHFAPP